MKYLPFVFLLLLSFVGCSHTATPTQESTDEVVASPDFSLFPVEEEKKTLSRDDSVKETLSVMENAAKEMKEAVESVEQVRAKDTTLTIGPEASKAFRKIQEFFSPNYFQYNDLNLWFLTNTGDKVGPWEALGKIEKCTYGLFSSYKRLIIYQQGGTVQTEFYVDTASGDLMVHLYRNGQRAKNQNYSLVGY